MFTLAIIAISIGGSKLFRRKYSVNSVAAYHRYQKYQSEKTHFGTVLNAVLGNIFQKLDLYRAGDDGD